MDASTAGLIGAAIGVAATLRVEALRQLAADRAKRAERQSESAGSHRDNLLGLQDSLLQIARLTSLIIENRTAKTPVGVQWTDKRTYADPDLMEDWRLARLEMLRYQVRIADDGLRAEVERCGNVGMVVVFGGEHAGAMVKHREFDEILMSTINPRIGELPRATY